MLERTGWPFKPERTTSSVFRFFRLFPERHSARGRSLCGLRAPGRAHCWGRSLDQSGWSAMCRTESRASCFGWCLWRIWRVRLPLAGAAGQPKFWKYQSCVGNHSGLSGELRKKRLVGQKTRRRAVELVEKRTAHLCRRRHTTTIIKSIKSSNYIFHITEFLAFPAPHHLDFSHHYLLRYRPRSWKSRVSCPDKMTTFE